ncbi:hypothetical protein KEH51_12285 [[Brevibacterium] frigoritolerans]|uniref:Uncharacterized protein n=1 Tax=Peribacillus frigoritolerans TaxID=450367 RepID=A0A941J7N6_9BACI|nr:hypothetical protein [Peribacillus frigoritolerans]
MILSDCVVIVDWSGCSRLLREKRVNRRHRRRKSAEEASDRPRKASA